MRKAISLCLLLPIYLTPAISQIFPIHPDFNSFLEQAHHDSSWNIHTSLKPVYNPAYYPVLKYGWGAPMAESPRKVLRHLTSKHLLEYENDDVYVTLDPVLDLSLMFDDSDTSALGNLFSNWRGLRCSGRLGKQVSFQTDFVEVQTRPAEWQRQWIDRWGVYPGYGRVKPFQIDAYDFAVSTGSVQYQPLHSLTLRLGSERQFIGNGYRSLMWSDALFPTPFLQARWNSPGGRWQYSSGFHLLQTLDRLPKGEVPESLFKRKGASVNYFSMKPWPGSEIGLFECVIWNMYDSSGTHGPGAGAYIPLLGVNSVLHGKDTVNNSMTGINVTQRLHRKVLIYGQWVLDHPQAKRMGWQTGCRIFDPGLKGMNVLLEWNHCSPYLYAFESPLQSYSHMQQPVGHPAGGSLDEWVVRLDYRYRRWRTRVHFSYLEQELDAGADVMSSPRNATQTFAPSPFRTLLNSSAELAFVINPAYSLEIAAGYQFRQQRVYYNWQDDTLQLTRLLYFGLRTAIFSRYNDF
jgi:hypothetical protein